MIAAGVLRRNRDVPLRRHTNRRIRCFSDTSVYDITLVTNVRNVLMPG